MDEQTAPPVSWAVCPLRTASLRTQGPLGGHLCSQSLLLSLLVTLKELECQALCHPILLFPGSPQTKVSSDLGTAKVRIKPALTHPLIWRLEFSALGAGASGQALASVTPAPGGSLYPCPTAYSAQFSVFCCLSWRPSSNPRTALPSSGRVT